MTEFAAGKQRGRPFERGVSGNPAGKPKGARHRITLLAERLMENDAQDVVMAVLAAARGGDMAAARLVLERISPVRRGRPVRLNLAPVNTSADLAAAVADLVAAVAAGQVTAEEGAAVGGLLGLQSRVLELTELEARLLALETRHASDN
jgi:hypothetical protein